jgi:eukaryotic-like serine/threonine-protein kinase
MSLEIGQQLGSYEITSLIGKGGMGEVYRGRDTKLKRDVAIKILPEEFSRDADRISRFQREAEVLASLNHPNIAAIYDVQEAEGSRFLILELIEGETLADRIQRGPVPVTEALNVAKSICEALEAAHEKGIVHRDLKPSNVNVTPDGKVKVLDFGLAKAMENAPTTALSNSPTLVNSMAGTNAGVILGTAAYMSPEQARGKKADARSDVFSLGCVLYEMLAARRAFQGEQAADVLVSVLAHEPDFTALPPNVSPQIRKLLSRCLAKNPNERWHAVADLRIELQDALANPAVEQAQTSAKPVVIRSTRREWVLGTIAVAAIIAFGVALWAPWRAASPAVPLRISGDLGADVGLTATGLGNSTLTLSPDGTMLAFVAAKDGASQIYIRRLGQLQAEPLAGTSGATSSTNCDASHRLQRSEPQFDGPRLTWFLALALSANRGDV